MVVYNSYSILSDPIPTCISYLYCKTSTIRYRNLISKIIILSLLIKDIYLHIPIVKHHHGLHFLVCLAKQTLVEGFAIWACQSCLVCHFINTYFSFVNARFFIYIWMILWVWFFLSMQARQHNVNFGNCLCYNSLVPLQPLLPDVIFAMDPKPSHWVLGYPCASAEPGRVLCIRFTQQELQAVAVMLHRRAFIYIYKRGLPAMLKRMGRLVCSRGCTKLCHFYPLISRILGSLTSDWTTFAYHCYLPFCYFCLFLSSLC